jgi:hypothetical protein
MIIVLETIKRTALIKIEALETFQRTTLIISEVLEIFKGTKLIMNREEEEDAYTGKDFILW